MAVKDLILAIPDWSTKTAEELTTELNAKSVEVRDTTLYTGKQLAKMLDVDSYRLLAGTIAAAAAQDPFVADAQGWLRSSGIDFSDAKTQAMIDTLAAAGSWPDVLRDAVKELGLKYVSPYVRAGGEGDVAMEAVTAAVAEIAADASKAALVQKVAARYNASVAGIEAGEITDWAGVVSLMSAE